MKETLPQSVQEIIDQYLHLPIEGKLIQCPYVKNIHSVRAGLKVYLGKGSSYEIIEETKILAQQQNVPLENMTTEQIREFMKKNNLGVDCSGLVSNILDAVSPAIIKQVNARSFWKEPVRFLIAKLRPFENISVQILTNEKNAECISDIHTIRPTDLIRTRNGKHILLITDVQQRDGVVKEIGYVHATSFYGSSSGVRKGSIKIIYPNESLIEQEWTEVDIRTGINYTFKGFREGLDSGIYRLKYKITKNTY